MMWIEELIILVALWLYFLGAAASSFENIHINGGFLDIWLSERNKHRLKVWATFCELVIVLIYFGLALKYFVYLVNSNKTAVYLRINVRCHWHGINDPFYYFSLFRFIKK